MGPNGSGKSTLANAVMGHPNFEVTEGQILFDGEDITEADPDERARAGLFMAFQYPVAIPGVSVAKYLRMVMNAHRQARGEAGGQPQGLPQDGRGGDGAHQRPARVLQPLPQRRLLRRREEAHGDPPARAAQPAPGRARRDRLGPRHRRAEHRRQGRQHRRRGLRHGRADHHPLPAHPAHGEAAVRAHHVRGPDRQGGRPGAASSSSRSAATAGSATRSPPPHEPRGPSRDGVPRPRAGGPGLPRLGRDVADAAVGDRGDGPLLQRVPREHPPRRLPARRRGDRGLRGRAREGRRVHRLDRRRDGLHRNGTEAINLVAYTWGRANSARRHAWCSRRWSTTRTSCRGSCSGCRSSSGCRSPTTGCWTWTRSTRALAKRPEARRRHARLERARHRQPDRRDRAPRPRGRRADRRRRHAGGPAHAGRRRARSTSTSTPGPATRPTGRPASASCTAAASCSRRCRRSSAAGT